MVRQLQFIFLTALVCFWVIACQPQPEETPDVATDTTPVFLSGTGASFPFFLYQRWFREYNSLHPHVQISYQPTGSAAGIQQFISATVDFAASDVAISDEARAQVEAGAILLPMTAGSVAVIYNLPGVEGLRLSREVYPAIFLGEITRWNDPKIQAINPNMDLPDSPISVVYRADGSGTTAAFTNHLSAISPQWRDRVGTGLNVQWTTGVGIKANAGVAAQVQQTAGTIGYVEYSYAQKLDLGIAALANQAGNYVFPTTEAASSALDGVELPEDLQVFIPDPEGEEAYPIVTYSWLLAYDNYDDPDKAKVLRDVIQWGLTRGQEFSEELGYVPLPANVVEKAMTAAAKIGEK